MDEAHPRKSARACQVVHLFFFLVIWSVKSDKKMAVWRENEAHPCKSALACQVVQLTILPTSDCIIIRIRGLMHYSVRTCSKTLWFAQCMGCPIRSNFARGGDRNVRSVEDPTFYTCIFVWVWPAISWATNQECRNQSSRNWVKRKGIVSQARTLQLESVATPQPADTLPRNSPPWRIKETP